MLNVSEKTFLSPTAFATREGPGRDRCVQIIESDQKKHNEQLAADASVPP